MKKRNGFTLIEITVVIVIIGIMAGLLIPRLPDVTSSRLKSTARRIAAVISYTYDRAAATGLVYRLTFDMEENGYYVSILNTENQFEETNLTFAKRTALPATLAVGEMVTESKGKVTAGEGHIHFFPGGYAERSVIHLNDQAGEQMTLFVHPLTGRVKILQGYLERADEA